MKFLIILILCIYFVFCATNTIVSLDDTFVFAVPVQQMNTTDLINLERNCENDGKCAYNGDLILGGDNANSSFFINLNQSPPGNLPLDRNYVLQSLSGLTWRQISDLLNMKFVTVAFSVPSNGCPLDGIPILGGLCALNPSVVRITRNNRDTMILIFLVGITILTLIVLFVLLKKTAIISEIPEILRERLDELK